MVGALLSGFEVFVPSTLEIMAFNALLLRYCRIILNKESANEVYTPAGIKYHSISNKEVYKKIRIVD